MNQGLYIKIYDRYEVMDWYCSRRFDPYDFSTNTESMALKMRQTIWKEFESIYSEWYEIFDAEVHFYENHLMGTFDFYIKYKCRSTIKPLITERLEYMIENLSCTS